MKRYVYSHRRVTFAALSKMKQKPSMTFAAPKTEIEAHCQI